MLIAFGINAQTNTAVVRGSVTDPGGANIAGAKVSVSNQETSVSYSADTNEAGLYSIPDVPAGVYTLTVENAGFKRYVRQGLTVNTGGTLSVDVKLEPGVKQPQCVAGAGLPHVPLHPNAGIDDNNAQRSRSSRKRSALSVKGRPEAAKRW